jgi:hypothetical protein
MIDVGEVTVKTIHKIISRRYEWGVRLNKKKYVRIEVLPQRKHCICITKMGWIMLLREAVTVFL